MKHPRLLSLTCVLLLGCGPSSDSAGDDRASESASTGDTDGAAVTGDSSSGDFSASGGSSRGDGEAVSTESSGGTEPADVCDIEETVNEAFEVGGAPLEDIVDCGTVTAADGPSAWSEMQACILDSAESHQPYKAFAYREGGDGTIEAFGSIAGADDTHRHWFTGEWLDAVGVTQCPEPSVTASDCEPSATSGTCVSCIGEGDAIDVVCPADAAPNDGTR